MKKTILLISIISALILSTFLAVQKIDAFWLPEGMQQYKSCYHGDDTLAPPIFIGVVLINNACEDLLAYPAIEALIIHQHATGYESQSNLNYNAGIHNTASHKHTDDPSSPECEFFARGF